MRDGERCPTFIYMWPAYWSHCSPRTHSYSKQHRQTRTHIPWRHVHTRHSTTPVTRPPPQRTFPRYSQAFHRSPDVYPSIFFTPNSDFPPSNPPLPLLRTQQLIRNPLHLHILHALWNLSFFLIKYLLTYVQNLEEFVFGEA